MKIKTIAFVALGLITFLNAEGKCEKYTFGKESCVSKSDLSKVTLGCSVRSGEDIVGFLALEKGTKKCFPDEYIVRCAYEEEAKK